MAAVGKPAAIGTAAAIATLVLSAPAARAQEGAADQGGGRGFGERGSVLFSIENVFGVLDQTYTATNNNSTSLNDNGFFPQGYVGTKLGLNALTSSGITWGGIIGFWTESSTNQNGGSFTSFNIGPRIGWAGCLKKYKALGFWGRVGPTFQYINLGSGGNNGADAWALDLSFEAFLVWSPVDHFGLLAGPTVDLGLTGHQSVNGAPPNTPTDYGYHSVGMSFGLVFEL
jgi:hypothetical protein